MEAATPKTCCRACHHPRPRDHRPTSAITTREALAESAASCTVCAVFTRGIDALVPAAAVVPPSPSGGSLSGSGGQPGDHYLRIDFNRALSRPSLALHDFASGTALSLFSPTGELHVFHVFSVVCPLFALSYFLRPRLSTRTYYVEHGGHNLHRPCFAVESSRKLLLRRYSGIQSHV